MNPVEIPLELALKKEARHRELLEMHATGDIDTLLQAAEVLNEALLACQVEKQWFCREASSNLAAAMKAKYADDRSSENESGSTC